MLELRAGNVVASDRDGGSAAEQRIVVELDEGARRPAIADVGLVGRCEPGDRVVINVAALDLGLGSGGFDVVHVNLTRGLDARAGAEARVMKLNYTSLQHAVAPVEDAEPLPGPIERPTAVLALHGQLAPLAWAFAAASPDARLGYVQTAGGALPGSRSEDVRELRGRGLLAAHITAGAAFGGEAEAMSVAGALRHGLCDLGWDAAVVGPGPGIVGSASVLGHGGMAALENLHTALALGCPTLAVARMSSADERPRHRGLSHHTSTVLDLLLAPASALRRAPATLVLAGGAPEEEQAAPVAQDGQPLAHVASEGARPSRIARHDWRRAPVDLPGYAASGLQTRTMGRAIAEDPLFFAAALAAGPVLAELMA